MNRKTTKRALGLSFVSLLLCFPMLMGTTFAWFTDNATVAVNKIESGTLDVELQKFENGGWVNAEGSTLGFVDDEGKVLDNILWEPGCSYLLQPFKIINKGSLALKFDVVVSAVTGDAKLAEVIEYGLLLGDVNNLSFVSMGDLNNFDSLFDAVEQANLTVLKPGEEFDTQEDGVTFHMKEDAGNEYQGMTVSGMSITVRATQATVEEDSYSNQYDKDAEYDQVVVVADQDALNAAVAGAPVGEPVTISLPAGRFVMPAGDIIKNKNITFTGSKKTVISFTELTTTFKMAYASGSDILFDGVTVDFGNQTYCGIAHANKLVYKNCTIMGSQTLYATDVIFNNCVLKSEVDNYCVWTWGTTNVNFSDCTFNTAGKAILVYNDGEMHTTVGIDKCKFNSDNTVANDKAAVEVGSSAYSTATTYNIYMNNCTETGFNENPKGTPTNSTFWGNKNSMDKDHLNVVIDGVDVY